MGNSSNGGKMSNEPKDKVPDWVYQFQAKRIGQRFAGATLATTRLDHGDAERVAKWAVKKTGMLLMMGKPGCGKTYVCSALVSWMYGKVADMYYFRESDFFSRLRASMDQQGDWNQELIFQCDHDFLLFDDIGSAGQGQTGWRQDVFLEIVNKRYESCKPTVFSTNYNEKEIMEKLGQRTYSRLFAKENTVIDMFGYPDLRLSM